MTGEHRDDPDATGPDVGAPAARATTPDTGGVGVGGRAPRRGAWRVGTPLVVLVCGALFVVSGLNSEGTDLRPGRYLDLATLTQSEADSYERLVDDATGLQEEVDALTAAVDDAEVRAARREAAALRAAAGLEPVSGPGVTVVLSDAEDDKFEEAVRNPDPAFVRRLVVHQQDIQAVVNAMWASGARAVTVQGQRLVTTTGIKCTGSAVRMHGLFYPQPYTIQAVGDPAAIAAALDANDDVAKFRADADNPDVGVGWSLAEEPEVEAPAYQGLLEIDDATPRG